MVCALTMFLVAWLIWAVNDAEIVGFVRCLCGVRRGLGVLIILCFEEVFGR